MLKRVFLTGAVTTSGALAFVLAVDAWVSRAGGRFCQDQIHDLPAFDAAVVLGCSPLVRGRPNRFFVRRIDAAAALFHSGKVRALIVSGDNSRSDYDEPTAMKEALVAAGVPESRIHCDYAGFRTLDSVVRADAIFGQHRFVVVSQRFHNERAVFIARRLGLEAWGLNAADVSRRIAPSTYLREYFARVKAVLDVTVLGTQPRFLGPPVEIDLAESR